MLVSRGHSTEVSQFLVSHSAGHFARWIGVSQTLWNAKTAESRQAYQNWTAQDRALGLPAPQATQAVAHFQTPEKPWIAEVPSQIRRNAGSEWYKAHQAALRGIRGAPKFRSRLQKRSALITSELFDARIENGNLHIAFKTSAKSEPFCCLQVPVPPGQVAPPKMLRISRKGRHFFLSWSYEKELLIESEAVLVQRLALTPIELQPELVLGVDLGVAQPVTTSTGAVLNLSPQERARLKKLEHKKKRYQRRMAGQKKTSKNRKKTKARFAKAAYTQKNIRSNFTHHASKALAEEAKACVVIEDLNVKGMTKRPKAKPILDSQGALVRFEKNRAAQKAGLNTAILDKGWSQLRTRLAYKLAERNKFLCAVPPHYSSQECSQCGFTHADNRKTQEAFACQSCGHQQNADVNAALVLKKRFLILLNTGKLFPKNKAVQKISPRRKPKENTAGAAEIQACGGCVRPEAILATPTKQEVLIGDNQIVGDFFPESRSL